MAKKYQNKKSSNSAKKTAKAKARPNLSNFNKLRSTIWKTDQDNISSYKKTAKIASYVQDKIQNRRNKGRVTNKYVHQATLSYFKDQENKKAQAAAKKKAQVLSRFNKLRSTIWQADQEKIGSYQKTAEIASYVKERIKNKRTKGPVTQRYIHQATLDYLNQQKAQKAKTAQKRKVNALTKFNKLRSRIWKIASDLITSYRNTAEIASYIQDKIQNRRIKGPVTDKYIRNQVLGYFKQLAIPTPPIPEEEAPEVEEAPIPEAEEEEEEVVIPEEEIPFPEIPELPEGLTPEPPILEDILDTPFPYYDLDQTFDTLQSSLEQKDILVMSPLSTLSQFRLNAYSYGDTFKTYVDQLNGTLGVVDSSEAPEVVVTPRYDEETNSFYLWVFEVGQEGAEITPGAEGLPPIVRELQREIKERQAGQEPPPSSISTPEQPTDFDQKRKLVEYKRAEMDKIQASIAYLDERKGKLIQDIANYRSLGMTEEVNKAMSELASITTETYKLNRQYIKASNMS